MKVFCRTALDAFKRERWPEEMVCRPIVGDYVQSEDGIRLRVVSVTHSNRYAIFDIHPGDKKYESVLIVELHN